MSTRLNIAGPTPIVGFRDIIGTIVPKGVGANNPEWAQMGISPFWGYKFAIGDEVWINYHVPHDYILGTGFFLHTHWIPSGSNTNTVKWQYTYTVAKGHQQGSAFDIVGGGTVITSEQPATGLPWEHNVSETVAINDAQMEPDSIIKVHISRITNGATDNPDDIFVDTADVHYQSNNSATKNRAPNFYE